MSRGGKLASIFSIVVFKRERYSNEGDRSGNVWKRFINVYVLLHVRAYGDSPVSLAMTHMRWLRSQRGHKSTGCTRGVVQCIGPSTHARTRTWARTNVRLRSLVPNALAHRHNAYLASIDVKFVTTRLVARHRDVLQGSDAWLGWWGSTWRRT